METKNSQALITRLPYSENYDIKTILDFANQVDERGLICLSIPVHVEAPNNGGKLIYELEKAGLYLFAKIAWYRDRHIVTSRSRRLTNTWEPIAIFSRSKTYIVNREAASKIKKGFETKESALDEDEYLTCIGDHWPVRNDRRDRRYLPGNIVLNCIQLADLHDLDEVLDPYGNPGVRDAVVSLGLKYRDGGLKSDVRGLGKKTKKTQDHQEEADA